MANAAETVGPPYHRSRSPLMTIARRHVGAVLAPAVFTLLLALSLPGLTLPAHRLAAILPPS